MLERTLAAQLKAIFGLDKVTFDVPGESQEQEGLFVQVETNRGRVKDGREVSRVTGTLRIFAQAEKMPLGYLSKAIDSAPPSAKQGLFFFNEQSRGTFRNIAERSMEFLYLFDSQYDPAVGTLSSVNLSISES